MKITVLIISSLRNIIKNKNRYFLTMIGIIIGIAAVITIVALGEGYKKKIINTFTNESDGTVKLNIMMTSTDNNIMNTGDLSFNYNDIKLVKGVSGVGSVKEVYNDEMNMGMYTNVSIQDKTLMGTMTKKDKTESTNGIIGREISNIDNDKELRTVVLKESLVKDKFDNIEDIIGDFATINGIDFEIVGIQKQSTGVQISFSFEGDVLIPKKTAEKYFGVDKTIGGLEVTLGKGANVEQVTKNVEDILNEKGSKKDQGEYMVMDTSGIIESLGSVLNMITTFIAAVASISLFIAGIGVMNMVYTSVSERVQEIGIKRSIGATKEDIRREFLVEGVVVTVIGGIIGYIIGIIVANLFSTFLKVPVVPSLFTAGLAIGISVAIGILSSLIPADKATRTNTADILK